MRLFIIFFIFTFGFLPCVVLAVDTDSDGFLDSEEVRIGTNPNIVDTDGDGFSDFTEVRRGYSPISKEKKKMSVLDTDVDGLFDDAEYRLGTSLVSADTDTDGFFDMQEVQNGFSPTSSGRFLINKKIVVDKTTQQLFAYFGNALLYRFPVSTGVRGSETPSGSFTIFQKVPNMRYTGPGYDLPGVKWNLHFKQNYFIHTAYWHDNFGREPMSHGCINVSEHHAKMLYDIFAVGTIVSVTGTTPIVVEGV